MKLVSAFCLCSLVFGLSLAEEEKNKRKEKIVSFYKCMACAPAEAHAAYAKCSDLKPERTQEYSNECLNQVIGTHESEEIWKHFCKTPTDIGKVYDCIAKGKDVYYKTLTEEEITAFKKFQECTKGLREQYCKE